METRPYRFPGRGRPRAPGAVASSGGQASVEWVGAVCLVATVFACLAFAAPAAPTLGFVHAIGTRMLCAASLWARCDRAGSLSAAYGEQVAAAVRARAPELRYAADMLGLPVDYRTCRSPSCAAAPSSRSLAESIAGEPVTLFTHVIDCRPGGRRPAGADCSGERAGNLYLQYWEYEPESASLRHIPILAGKGYHRNDWESMQVRVAGDGTVSARASSHHGYNHSKSIANWGSDAGIPLLTGVAEELGLRSSGGWGDATGELLISGGSHAGNVDGDRSGYPGSTPSGRVRLVPLEQIRDDPDARPARFDPITPPWTKRVWLDPEFDGTG